MTKKQKKTLYRIILSAALMLLLHFIPTDGLLRFALYLIPYWIIGHDILRKAWKGIRNRQVCDENFLMAIATIGAMLLGLTRTGDYVEGIAVMLFYQIGELFQSCAVGKSRRSISQLMDIRPDYANVERDGRLEQVDPDEVEIGTVILVQPGEKVPIDGIVLDGSSSLNTSALTGESLPRDVFVGDEIVSGCINLTGVLRIQTTKAFEESTVSKILDLVENASSRKSRSEALISRFARVYTPMVCTGALALAVFPPLVRVLVLGMPPLWSDWLYRALTFLVISCPCALVISVPLSFFAGLGGASREGILIKGSNYLEALAQTEVVVFDKTGTLTQGVFELSQIGHNTLPEAQLLEYAALAECASSHPVSQSLQRAYGREPDRTRVTDIREISGYGVVARVDGQEIAVGNGKLMEQLQITYKESDCEGTIIYIGIDGVYAGFIAISDQCKPTAPKAVARLKQVGVRKTVMLTGDLARTANKVAEALHIDEVYSELLPGDKVSQVERLLNEKGLRGKLAFVGDGINDAPVLSRADVGIAMGAMGSDAAIEAADIVLMDDDPEKLVKAIRISRKCMGIVYQNMIFSLGVKFACLGLSAVGAANMWLAIFADVGVMILAVLNAIRALNVRHL